MAEAQAPAVERRRAVIGEVARQPQDLELQRQEMAVLPSHAGMIAVTTHA